MHFNAMQVVPPSAAHSAEYTALHSSPYSSRRSMHAKTARPGVCKADKPSRAHRCHAYGLGIGVTSRHRWSPIEPRVAPERTGVVVTRVLEDDRPHEVVWERSNSDQTVASMETLTSYAPRHALLHCNARIARAYAMLQTPGNTLMHDTVGEGARRHPRRNCGVHIQDSSTDGNPKTIPAVVCAPSRP